MKSFLFIVLILLLPFVTGNPFNSKLTRTLDQEIKGLSKYISRKGCRRTQICFALYNNQNAITEKEYKLQKVLVKSIAKVISNDRNVRFFALQYGAVATLISPSSKSPKHFFGLLDKARTKKQPGTSLDAPIVLCDALFAQGGKKIGAMVLFGNGQRNFGGDPQFTSGILKGRGGRIFTVGVGNMNKKVLQKISGERSHRVETLDAFWKVRFILANVISALCVN